MSDKRSVGTSLHLYCKTFFFVVDITFSSSSLLTLAGAKQHSTDILRTMPSTYATDRIAELLNVGITLRTY